MTTIHTTGFDSAVTPQWGVWSRVTGMVTAARLRRRTHGPGYFEAGVIARAQYRL